MNKYLRPKLFHFTKDYNIAPVSKSRGSYKEESVIYFNSEKVNVNRRNNLKFMICSKVGMKGKDSCVCEVVDVADVNKNPSLTSRMIDSFFVRRKSTGRRRKLVRCEAGEVDWVKGESFDRKNLQSLPDKPCSSTFEYFDDKKKGRSVRNRVRIKLDARMLRNSISVQTEI